MFIVFALLVRPIAGEHVAVVSVKLQLLPARDVWMIMCFYAVLGDRGRGATLHAEEWLLPLAMACDLESESSVSYQSPLALSRCVCDLSQICEIFLCAEPNHF